MTDFVFAPYLFLRTPALSYDDFTEASLASELKTSFFQSAIFFASESLYLELREKSFEYFSLEEKVKISLQKYFNRMCYRPTPFGMFSAFSSLYWHNANSSEKCIISDQTFVHINPDFRFSVEIARKMEDSGLFDNVRYFPSNAIYSVRKEKRYLTQRFDVKKEKTDFFINSFESNRVLNRLLQFSKEGKTKTELTDWLQGFVDVRAEAEDYIIDLINEGLLNSELSPNMTGEKYFDRIAGMARQQYPGNSLKDEVLNYHGIVSEFATAGCVDFNRLNNSVLYNQLKAKYKSMFYVGLEKVVHSSLDARLQNTLRDGLNCLLSITAEGARKSLNNFMENFRARFEDQEVPLLLALDREAGVGYEGLEVNLFTSELLEGIQLDLQSSKLSFNWTPVHEFFLSKLVGAKNKEPIVIADEEIERLPGQTNLEMPPGFSVIFRVYGDKIWLEQAGGCTAGSLLGRFSLLSDAVKDEVVAITQAEEKTNPEVIFAEISCFNDEHAANINTNAGVRRFEIPIGVHSTYAGKNIISLSDLLVSVSGGKIILRSMRYNKIVIPRLSSAYNYSRSELTVFRFLCDLQLQGVRANYSFDLRSLLPGLSFYPRVEHRNCIICPAMWVLNDREIAAITTGEPDREKFRNFANEIALHKLFALSEGDNQLIFNADDPASVDLFTKTIKNKTTVVLTEVFVDQPSIVTDENNKPYAGQFIASLIAQEPVYTQQKLNSVKRQNTRMKRVYLPGDEWLYYKLYCHPSISNTVLLDDVVKIIKQLKRQGILKSWFFIRYTEGGPHLRVRVKINPADAARVMGYFEKRLRARIARGSISNIIMDTYKREIERYGERTMEYAETIFRVSSDLVTAFLGRVKSKGSEIPDFQFAIITVIELLDAFFDTDQSKKSLVKQLYESMRKEFDDSKQVKVQLDSKYRGYSAFFNSMGKIKPVVIGLSGKTLFCAFGDALRKIRAIEPALQPTVKIKLAADLIHMHLNRLFSDKQRSHEFVIYYLLYKYYVSAEARQNKNNLAFSPTFKGSVLNEIEEIILK